MANKITLIPFILAFIFSCKTAEQIKREKLVNNLNNQMSAGQKQDANMTVQIHDLEGKISELKGEIEESRYLSQKTMQENIKQISENMLILTEKQKTFNELMEKQEQENTAIKKSLRENKKYLNKLLASLSKATGIEESKRKSKKVNPYNQAMRNYKKRRYKTAKAQLLRLLKNKKIKGNKRARILHNLGMIQFFGKKYSESKVYFSRLYTEHPKAPYNPNGLLYLGKIFKKLKETEQAKQTFLVLLKTYPKSSQKKEAEKLLKTLK